MLTIFMMTGSRSASTVAPNTDRLSQRAYLGLGERLTEVVQALVMVLLGEQVPDSQRHHHGPVNDAEQAKRGEAAVVRQPSRLRQPDGSHALGQRHGNGVLIQSRSPSPVYPLRYLLPARAASITICRPSARGLARVPPGPRRAPGRLARGPRSLRWHSRGAAAGRHLTTSSWPARSRCQRRRQLASR